jgi:hypothetical protein
MTTIRSFIIKLLLFSIPFVLFVALYFYLDPFKVVNHYDVYYKSGQPNYISLNKDFVSTENWVNHHQQFGYDSYIFGNSRSMFYEIDTWSRCINESPEKCYHFDASAESIFGIARKLSYLDAQHMPIKNALFVIDEGALNKADNSGGHIFIKDPRTSGESAVAFQVEFIKDFFDFDFLWALADFKISGKVKDYMTKDFLLDDRPFLYNYVTNQVRMEYFEDLIKKDTAAYYGPRNGIFYPRDMNVQKVAAPVIHEKQLALLDTIQNILKRNNTSFRIVISPLYDQRKLSPADLLILQNLFGKENIFDFSGINSFTRSKYNYYEASHYRPHIADSIMKIIYSNIRA